MVENYSGKAWYQELIPEQWFTGPGLNTFFHSANFTAHTAEKNECRHWHAWELPAETQLLAAIL